MDDKRIISAATGYIAGNAITNNLVRNLRKCNEEAERALKHWTPEETLSAEIAKFLLANNRQGAFEYLNEHLNEEIVEVALNQKDYIYSLETMLEKRKDKYMPFYKRIEKDMPENLQALTADELCNILGVQNLHIIDSVDGKSSPSKQSDDIGCSTIICAILIIGLVILSIALSMSEL